MADQNSGGDAQGKGPVPVFIQGIAGRSPLPTHFAGRQIRFRVPFTMPGEVAIDVTQQLPTSGSFPDAVFQHGTDKPFEIHRLIPRVTLINTDTSGPQPVDRVIFPQPNLESGLGRIVRLRILDVSKNENMNRNAQLIETLTPANTRAWEFEDPYTIVRAEFFQVSIDILPFFPNPIVINTDVCDDGELTCLPVPVTKFRIDMSYQGFLLVIAEPSEQR